MLKYNKTAAQFVGSSQSLPKIDKFARGGLSEVAPDRISRSWKPAARHSRFEKRISIKILQTASRESKRGCPHRIFSVRYTDD